jgi:hypothetical protein
MCRFLAALFSGIFAGASLGGVLAFVCGCMQTETGPISLGSIQVELNPMQLRLYGALAASAGSALLVFMLVMMRQGCPATPVPPTPVKEGRR